MNAFPATLAPTGTDDAADVRPRVPIRWRPDAAVWLAVVIAAVVLIPRGIYIVSSQSERVDDEYHLIRGVLFWKHALATPTAPTLNDPPLGEALGVLPLRVLGAWPRGRAFASALWGWGHDGDALLVAIAVWKSLLFLPMVAVVFRWVREVYDARAAWLAVALLLGEPTFAAHVPLPTLDVIGVEGIVIGCYLGWRYVDRPTIARLLLACASTGAAMMLKHTAVILPFVIVLMAGIEWGLRPWYEGRTPEALKGTLAVRLGQLLVAPVLVAGMVWALCMFDVSRPVPPAGFADEHPAVARLVDRRMPAGVYVASFLAGQSHAGDGHAAYLFGEKARTGWWYYFPVLATYKVPVGTALVALLALASLVRLSPGWREVRLLLPAAAWAALMFTSKINIGWRHFLPAYVFLIMLAARGVAGLAARPGPLDPVTPARRDGATPRPLVWLGLGWAGAIAAAMHAVAFHPNYLAYINAPRDRAHLQISDSNIDWGQGLKDARAWAVGHPDRNVFVRDFGWGVDRMSTVRRRFQGLRNVTPLDRGDVLPKEGVLIISPVPVAGVYERSTPFRVLLDARPDEVLANGMFVFDLDRLRREGRFDKWPRYRPAVDDDGRPKPPEPGWPDNAFPRG